MEANYVQRLRLTFSKGGPARYAGHLDLARSMERACRRADLPLAYTQGFNPRPRMQFADALPLGFIGEREMVDVWLTEPVDPKVAWVRLAEAMAPGIVIIEVAEQPLKLPPLQTQTVEAHYLATIKDAIGSGIDRVDLEQRAASLMAADHLYRERRGKKYDLRPLIRELEVVEGEGRELALRMRLIHRPELVARPDEVLLALNLDPHSVSMSRTRLAFAASPVAEDDDS